MNLVSWILTAALAVGVFFALRAAIRDAKTKRSCNGYCAGCTQNCKR